MIDQKFKYVAVFELNGEKSALVFDSAKNAVDYLNMIVAEHESAVKSVEIIENGKYRLEFYGDVAIFATIVETPAAQVKYHLVRAENNQYIETRRFSKLTNALTYVRKEFKKHHKLRLLWDIGLGVYKIKVKNLELKFYLSVALIQTDIETETEIITHEIDNEYYDVLEVKRGANEDEIKKAYRDKSKKAHPDFGGSAEAFKKVNEAYRKLMEEAHGDGIIKEENEVVETTKVIEKVLTYPCVDIAKLIKNSQSGWDFIKKALGF